MHTSKACLMKLAHVSMKSLMNTIAGQRLKEFVTDTSKILDDAFVVKKKFYLKVHKVSC